MWRYGAAVLLALVLVPTVAKSEATVNEFLSHYDSAKPAMREFIEQVASETENGLDWANSYLETIRQEKRLFCHPDKLVLTGPKILDMLRREAKETPATGNYPFGYGILAANIKVFPCS
jgi:hypothetical protein